MKRALRAVGGTLLVERRYIQDNSTSIITISAAAFSLRRSIPVRLFYNYLRAPVQDKCDLWHWARTAPKGRAEARKKLLGVFRGVFWA